MKYKTITFLLFFITCYNCIFAQNDISIHSKSVIALDADTAAVLYGKNANDKLYPASTTKIITAILAIENLDLNKSVVVSKSAINIPWDSSSVYLKEGEIITVKDLLYCLLLNSGNDAANVLAESVSGDINTFVKLMNIKAKEIGCENTHFNNAHGYSDDQHYTTAMDMAKIFRYCINNKTFEQIISTKSYIVNETNKTNSKRYLNNTNRLILKKEDSIYSRYYEWCVGGKTGYTDEAGRTLITYGVKDGKTVIVGVFGASASGLQDVRYTDAINLFEYSFDNFDKQVIATVDNYNYNYINIDKKLIYSVGIKENLEVLLNRNFVHDISYSIEIDETKLKDFDKNNLDSISVGTITFNITSSNNLTSKISQELYLKNVNKYTTNINLTPFILIVATLFIVFIIIVLISSKSNKHSYRSFNKVNRKKRK